MIGFLVVNLLIPGDPDELNITTMLGSWIISKLAESKNAIANGQCAHTYAIKNDISMEDGAAVCGCLALKCAVRENSNSDTLLAGCSWLLVIRRFLFERNHFIADHSCYRGTNHWKQSVIIFQAIQSASNRVGISPLNRDFKDMRNNLIHESKLLGGAFSGTDINACSAVAADLMNWFNEYIHSVLNLVPAKKQRFAAKDS